MNSYNVWNPPLHLEPIGACGHQLGTRPCWPPFGPFTSIAWEHPSSLQTLPLCLLTMPSFPLAEIKCKSSSCLPGKCFTDSPITRLPSPSLLVASASVSRFGTNVLYSLYDSFVSFPLSDLRGGWGGLSSYPLDITPEVTRVPDRKEASGKHFVKKEYFSFTL